MSENKFGGEIKEKKENTSFDTLKKGDWYCVEKRNTSNHYIRYEELEDGQIIGSAFYEVKVTDNGYEYMCFEKPIILSALDINAVYPIDESEINSIISQGSPFVKNLGEYIGISNGEGTFIGKLDKIYRDHIELKPSENTRLDAEGNIVSYIEEEKPMIISTDFKSIRHIGDREGLERIIHGRNKASKEARIQEAKMLELQEARIQEEKSKESK